MPYEVHELLLIGPWEQLFTLNELAFRELTLEVLGTFSHLEGADQLEQRRYDTVSIMGGDGSDVLQGLFPPFGTVQSGVHLDS